MEVLSPTSGSPAWGSENGRRSPQEIWLWRPADADGCYFTGLKKTETLLLAGAPGHRVKSTSRIKAWARHICWYWKVPCRGEGLLRLTAGTDTGGGSSGEYLVAGRVLEATIFSPGPGPSQQPVSSSAGDQQRGNMVQPISKNTT